MTRRRISGPCRPGGSPWPPVAGSISSGPANPVRPAKHQFLPLSPMTGDRVATGSFSYDAIVTAARQSPLGSDR